MRTALRSLVVAALVCGLGLSLAAAPKEGKRGKKKGDKPAAVPAAMYKLPDSITLTDEQKPKLAAIQKEFTPKFRELARKNRELLTPEQRAARKEAMEKTKAAGTKGKQRQSEIEAAMNLSDTQKEQLAKLKEATAKLRGEMETKVVALLTAEQKAELPKKKGRQGNKRKRAA